MNTQPKKQLSTASPISKPSLGKTIALLLFLFGPLGNLLAQSSTIDSTFGYHYKMIVEAPIYLTNILGTKLSDSLYEAPDNAIFTHIGNTSTQVIIRFWLWNKKSPEAIKTYNYTDSTESQQCYFLMSQSDFQQKTIRVYSRRPAFTVGTAAVPFKIRAKPFQFTNDVGIGPVVGAKFRLSKLSNSNFFNVLMGFGLSSVNLDSMSTEGNITTSSLVTNPAALTVSLGGVFEFSNIQVGVFVGQDYINNNKTINWVYQGKPWISIGLGFALFTKSTANQQATNPGVNTVTVGGT